MWSVMISFMGQVGYSLVPRYSNTNIGVAVKVFCKCDNIYNQLTLHKGNFLDNLGGPDPTK